MSTMSPVPGTHALTDDQIEFRDDLFGLPFDESYGGTGTGALTLNVAVEEIARACASSALMLMVQELGTLPIKLFGSEELKQRFLPRCASGGRAS
jgi:alkylation response protein AidB-like acyl-CoA dehydrogenase